MPLSEELEFIEEYMIEGRKRFRFKVKNTNVVINVSAKTIEEAKQKAQNMLKILKIKEAFKGQI